MSEHFDAIVIGAGQAGPALAGRLDRQGLETAIIERHRLGGTCVNFGCTPTKAMVGSARVARMARRAAEFGISVGGPVTVDMARVKARKDAIVAQSVDGLGDWLGGMNKVELIRGHARFCGPHEVEVGDRRLQAPRIFVNVGARARVPEFPGGASVELLTNSDMLELDVVPEHLLIVGGSYIGLEFAQMMRRFGSRVTVIEMADRLIAREDADVSEAVQEILQDEGVEIRLAAECIDFEPTASGVRMQIDCAEDASPIDGSHVLLAVGRTPNTHDLGLEAAGVVTDERGFIRVDEQLRTNVDGIWALGEVNGRGAFTHTSYNDYEIIAANLFDDKRRRVDERIPCHGLFIDPPLGRVGMTEREVRERGRPALIGTLAMQRVGRAREFGETQGFMKILVDAQSERILGASILGLSGDEVVHCLIDLMAADQPYTVLARSVHIHPTVAELLPTLVQNLEPLAGTD